jgi:hypothetical protein
LGETRPRPFNFKNFPFYIPSQPTFLSSHHPTIMTLLRQGSLWGLVLLAGLALAHGGHEAVPEGEAISLEPIVRGLFGLSGFDGCLRMVLLILAIDHRTRRYGHI